MTLVRTAFVLLAATAAAAASAQTMKPGLWEMKQTPQMDPARQAQMAKAQKAMENMPPAQKQMMQDMMAKKGVSMDFAGGVITVKSCITAEQAARNLTPHADQGRCTHDVKRSGNVISNHFSCTEPASEGESTVTLQGDTGFTSQVTMTHQRAGKPETMTVSGEGHWLGSDCGNIKPMQSKAK